MAGLSYLTGSSRRTCLDGDRQTGDGERCRDVTHLAVTANRKIKPVGKGFDLAYTLL